MDKEFSSTLLENAVSALATLPGIGRKTSLRLILHLLRQDESVAVGRQLACASSSYATCGARYQYQFFLHFYCCWLVFSFKVNQHPPVVGHASPAACHALPARQPSVLHRLCASGYSPASPPLRPPAVRPSGEGWPPRACFRLGVKRSAHCPCGGTTISPAS